MNKYILLSLLILFIPMVSAMNITAGNESVIYTIKECEGPVDVKITSEEGIKNDELFIIGCDKENNNRWNCNCDKSFDLIINTKNDTLNMYDFTVRYYVDFKNYNTNNNREPTLDSIQGDNNIRTTRIIDVLVKPEEPKKFKFKISMETKNVMMGSFLIAFLIIMLLLFKGKSFFSSNNKQNNDVFNYRNKEDEELDDILNDIK